MFFLHSHTLFYILYGNPYLTGGLCETLMCNYKAAKNLGTYSQCTEKNNGNKGTELHFLNSIHLCKPLIITVCTEYYCKIEMMNPCWSCSYEYIKKIRQRV